MVTTFEQPGVGQVEAFARPFQMSGIDDLPWLRRPAPHLGEHTDEVLRELGYGAEEIEAIKAMSALGRGAEE
jgi:formyl-CoA transferase